MSASETKVGDLWIYQVNVGIYGEQCQTLLLLEQVGNAWKTMCIHDTTGFFETERKLTPRILVVETKILLGFYRKIAEAENPDILTV